MSEITSRQRKALGTVFSFWKNHADLIDYVEVRSSDDIMSTHGLSFSDVIAMFARGEHIAMDCSEAITTAFRWVGLKDPNGPDYNYNGYGNTGTMSAYLPHFDDPHQLHEGSLIMFEPPPQSLAHVVAVTKKNDADVTDPWVFSNGSEAGPYIYHLRYDAIDHPGQEVVYLEIDHLG